MNRYDVKITEYALEQMQEIVQYISETLYAPDAAHSLLESIKSAMTACAELPERNPTLTREPWHSRGIRKIIVKNFYAYYWIDEECNQVWFISVVYSKRNQMDELLRADTQD